MAARRRAATASTNGSAPGASRSVPGRCSRRRGRPLPSMPSSPSGCSPTPRGVADLQPWALALFRRSVLKQRKLAEIVAMLGPTEGLRCLDLGSDNGVVSLLLRRRGGRWASADLTAEAVASIRELVTD